MHNHHGKIALGLSATLLMSLMAVSWFVYHTVFALQKPEEKITISELFPQHHPQPKKNIAVEAEVTAGPTVVVPIFMYHHVGLLPANPDAVRSDLTVSTDDFAKQVEWISQQGYHTITLADLYNYSINKFDMPSKPAIFTFDDGYSDVFDNAVPVLRKYGFIGSFGIITSKVGTEEGTNAYANWEQIAAAQGEGMEIVSHTRTHFDGNSKKYDGAFEKADIASSLEDIKTHLGTTTNILIYPFGHYNGQYREAMHQAGIAMGITEIPSAKVNLNDLDEVPRIRVHGKESIESFQKILKEKVGAN